MTRVVLFAAALILFIPSSSNATAQSQLVRSTTSGNDTAELRHPGADLWVATPADPARVVGTEKCVKCHASEIKVWQATPHAKTVDLLHRRPEAKQIAAKLGIRSIKHEGRCVACHYTQQTDDAGRAHVVAGVSCESCHGAAQNWVDIHHDYGGKHVTRLMETPEHRAERLAASLAAGMRNPANVYLVAQSCLRCHTTADEELVNVGGHPTGSLDFEFVAWSQGTLRHNFVRSDGKLNAENTPERLRVMFVAGMIAELEASLRATATATEKATYGITSAKRAARAAKRLQSVAAKVDAPKLDQILELIGKVRLTLNNQEAIDAVADRVAELGYRFAAEHDGSRLGALDAYIPTTRK
jgi:hypothetical protein